MDVARDTTAVGAGSDLASETISNGPAVGEGDGAKRPGRVELIVGDMFDGDAGVLVVPISTVGTATQPVRSRLRKLNVPLPDGERSPGEVIPASVVGGSGIPRTVVFATSVEARESTVDIVESAARHVGEVITEEGAVVGFPLLGSGAGGLTPEDSARAMMSGFLSSAPDTAVMRIYVLSSELFERVQPVLPTIVDRTRPEPGSAKEPDETVPIHTDNPAKVDELGRVGLASILARRIRDVRSEEDRNAARSALSGHRREARGGAFLVHLHAPWGAGKTSLLNFLADELRNPEPGRGREPWVVVNFNAWRHQRIAPPWWWLMTTLYEEAIRELRGFDRRRAVALMLHEWWWRIRGGWKGLLVILAGVAVLVWAWRTGFLDSTSQQNLLSADSAKRFLVAAAAIATPLLTLWGLLRAVGRWVFATSARGARRFIDNTRDPMRLVQEHLRDLVNWIHHDVVVLIDDLDRCKGPYVVELLEGVQTLFREVPVTYVVAADRDWLADSYTKEYVDFPSAMEDPGRPVGYLFLEKTFQISAPLPPAGRHLDAFWGRLLRSADLPGHEDLRRARTAAKEELRDKSSREAQRLVATSPGATAADVQARREMVAIDMASDRAALSHAHLLEPFSPLLGREENPRLMKRLINAYGIARGVETLRGYNLVGDPVREKQTALWTILNLRWPKLGTHLMSHPEHLAQIGRGNPPEDAPAAVRALFDDADVVSVVRGDADGVDARLDPARIDALLGSEEDLRSLQ